MGEYADMAIDDMLSIDEWELNNPWEVEPDSGVFRRNIYHKPQPKTCRHCGQTGLVWAQIDGKWRLHDYSEEEDDLVQHLCL